MKLGNPVQDHSSADSSSEPLHFGVMGAPIDHSLSPEIFQFISTVLKYPVVYKKLCVQPQELKKNVEEIKSRSLLNGWNVTIPHKEAIAELVDFLSPEAKATGAINVVQVIHDQLYGWNTDIDGIASTLREQNFEISGSSAVIFGAGGGALAVGFVLGRQKASQVLILNRTYERSKKFALQLSHYFPKTEYIPCESHEDFSQVQDVQLYVNATPLGMKRFPGQPKLPSTVTPGALAFDLVYQPENTLFLKKASHLGLKTVGGLDMLCWQALAAWEIWVGKIPNPGLLKSQLKCHLRDHLKLGDCSKEHLESSLKQTLKTHSDSLWDSK